MDGIVHALAAQLLPSIADAAAFMRLSLPSPSTT
jgi:hypothetical protein